jgi:hypothetical protein
MPAPEALTTMLGELTAMSAEDRGVILAALTRKERYLLDRLGQTMAGGQSHSAGLSPWLAPHVEAARRGDASMTPATREALLRAVGTSTRERDTGPAPAGRSLAGAFGGLLAARAPR